MATLAGSWNWMSYPSRMNMSNLMPRRDWVLFCGWEWEMTQVYYLID